jgi:TldD protein
MKMRKIRGAWNRREFLATAAAGAGIVVIPSFLAGCRGTANPFATGTALGGADHFSQFGVDDALIKKVLGRALSTGGDFADLFFQHLTSHTIALEDGAVNRAYSGIELGCGVRVLKGDQTGFAFTEDLSPKALTAAAETAAAVADGPAAAPLDSIQQVATPSYYVIERPWYEVAVQEKIPLVEQVSERALAFDKRIKKTRVSLSDSTSYVLVASSDGRFIEDVQPMTELGIGCTAEQDGRREENGASIGARRGIELYSPEKLNEQADIAARNTVVLFDAAQPPAGEYPVVLAPGLSGILLHEAIGHGMEADFNRKGTSVYADRIGKPIAPEFVTIVDDGTNPNERGTLNMDDEGCESTRTVLVENGILASYMHDHISSKHYGVEPTGNGRRDCYRYPPVPRMRNTYMLNGPHTRDEILRSVKKGVYAERFTNGEVRIGSGDFSFYLKNGYMIENGKLGRPIKDANLVGFGPKVLEEVQMVGDDLALYSGSGWCGKDGQSVPVGFGLPTIKCGGISVGGVS